MSIVIAEKEAVFQRLKATSSHFFRGEEGHSIETACFGSALTTMEDPLDSIALSFEARDSFFVARVIMAPAWPGCFLRVSDRFGSVLQQAVGNEEYIWRPSVVLPTPALPASRTV